MYVLSGKMARFEDQIPRSGSIFKGLGSKLNPLLSIFNTEK